MRTQEKAWKSLQKEKKRQQTPQGSGCPRCSRQMASVMKKRQTNKMEAGATQDVGTARHRQSRQPPSKPAFASADDGRVIGPEMLDDMEPMLHSIQSNRPSVDPRQAASGIRSVCPVRRDK